MEFWVVVLWLVGLASILAGVYLWLGLAAGLIALGIVCIVHVIGIMKYIGEKP